MEPPGRRGDDGQGRKAGVSIQTLRQDEDADQREKVVESGYELARDERIVQDGHRRAMHEERAALPDAVPGDEVGRDRPSPGEKPSCDVVGHEIPEAAGRQNEHVDEAPTPRQEDGERAAFGGQRARFPRRPEASRTQGEDEGEDLQPPEDPIEDVDRESTLEHFRASARPLRSWDARPLVLGYEATWERREGRHHAERGDHRDEFIQRHVFAIIVEEPRSAGVSGWGFR
jgi:hypothetical protein